MITLTATDITNDARSRRKAKSGGGKWLIVGLVNTGGSGSPCTGAGLVSISLSRRGN